jgi:hypothetical protein
MIYHIKGNLRYLRMCQCEHCEGHVATLSVDNLVEGATVDDAIERIWTEYSHNFDLDLDLEDLEDELTVTEATPEQIMIHTGQPMLFDL